MCPSPRSPSLPFVLRASVRTLSGTASVQEAFLHYEAAIYPCSAQGANEKPLAGEVAFSRVDFDRARVSPAEVLACDEEASEYTALIRTKLGRRVRWGETPPVGEAPIAALKKLLPEATRIPNLLLIHKIHLLPHARGRGWAVPVLTEVMRRFGAGAGLAALLPYPLQYGAAAGCAGWIDRMQYNRFSAGKREAIQKLKALYAQAGFVPVRGTALMVADLLELSGPVRRRASP